MTPEPVEAATAPSEVPRSDIARIPPITAPRMSRCMRVPQASDGLNENTFMPSRDGAHGADGREVVVADHARRGGVSLEELGHRSLAPCHATVSMRDCEAIRSNARASQRILDPKQPRSRGGIRGGGSDVPNPPVPKAKQVLRRHPGAAAVVTGDGR